MADPTRVKIFGLGPITIEFTTLDISFQSPHIHSFIGVHRRLGREHESMMGIHVVGCENFKMNLSSKYFH